jgi:transglycosylase-like protein with SLT domain
MSRTARLESILAGGVLVAALAVVGTVPVEAQQGPVGSEVRYAGGAEHPSTLGNRSAGYSAPPAASTAPEDVPADEDVEWGPVVEEDPSPVTTVPVPVPPAPRVGREQPAGGDDLERLPAPASGPSPEGGAEAPGDGGALRNADGSPTVANPGFFDALPGPSVARGVPNFVIRKFRVPLFLLPIYQAAGIEYGVRWEVLAAINEIETDYGRNLNVSSAGALGWMQFMPSSWEAYGVDANKDGRKDPYNPVDAIFAAARYLKAANYENDVRGAIFAYNHADWYVDSVLLRARLISGVPADLVGSLTGLTEGRFPVAARARYADDLAEQEVVKRVEVGENAANVVESEDDRRSLEIYAQKGSPVVATNDGVIKKVGETEQLGNYIVLQDVYGNRYTYSGLGEVADHYPVLEEDATDVKAIKAHGDDSDPEPVKAASAGSQAATDNDDAKPEAETVEPAASLPFKERLFAHPNAEGARESGGLEQVLDAKARQGGKFETYRNYFSRPFGADAKDVRLKRLKVGAQVIGGTILGRVGKIDPDKAAHLEFAIRPAGKGAPSIDPKPILDGWKLLEATAIYRAAGKNALYGRDAKSGLSIGQILLLPKPLLEKRVLSDERIELDDSGRTDIQSGQIDRRVLATLAYLADSGLRPTVTSLKSDHGLMTASGNVSEHSSGNAVDIAQINGVPIYGHQEPGGVTDQSVRRLMRLQGTMAPHQIISLLDYGQNTYAMADHNDHIHVGFRPLFGDNKKLGQQALAVLKPGQWSDLIARLREIDNPVVPTEPSKYALPADKPASDD